MNYEKGLRLLLTVVFVLFVYSVLTAHFELRQLRSKIEQRENEIAVDEDNVQVEVIKKKVHKDKKSHYIYPKRYTIGNLRIYSIYKYIFVYHFP